MIWLGFVILSLIVLAPFMLAQRHIRLRGRRESALVLYRAQLVELENEGERGRIGPAEQAQAKLEIERRLLSTASTPEEVLPKAGRLSWLLPAMVLLLPALAIALYLPGATPMMPAAPLAPRIAAAEEQARQDLAMLDMLRAKLQTLDPHSEQARQGFVLMGNMEAGMGDAAAASAAWAKALEIRSDPQLLALKAQADAAAQSVKAP
ncbi:c-type cytochrome biogenesis protein CcmI [Acidisoma cladoniae]|jgi:cytochrome c-type biogenesis protein CcmH|uniref:c-type cytochrome biogenesis protein CcmI n=1 Tax=Acidisoma cladoniae TaxID=3040935 RepID=UPI00254FEA9E|nr:c-type cytochrome biogenesis protein CcmI [Acidisoma sp. PAMC 29798]